MGTKLNLPHPMRAHISGGHAQLIRYAETDEREQGLLGYYDNFDDTEYPLPNLPDDALVDSGYTKVWIRDALLPYLTHSIGDGGVVTKLAGFNNRIRAENVIFATGNGDDRDAELFDRDVAIGDVVKVRGLNSSSAAVTLWTYVQAIIADTVASTTEPATADASNADTQAFTDSEAYVSGPINCVTLVADGSTYDGSAAGHVTETYDVLVTASSAGGDFTTAVLRIISGSGTDNQTAVTPAAAGAPTTIGTRGMKITLDVDPNATCSASAATADVPSGDLVAGQRWQVTVSQIFTAPVPTGGGTYTGARDTTYIVTVTRGGKYTNPSKPQITVSTTNGIDVSGPTTVAATATPVSVGTKGVTIQFSQTALCKGDRYYIVAGGTADGPFKILQLGHNLDTDIATGSELDLTLYIRKDLLQIPMNRMDDAPNTNWDATATAITLNSGITAFDSTYTDGGVPVPMEVISDAEQDYGAAYVEVRYWIPLLATSVGTIVSEAGLDLQISGPLSVDNPLKWGVAKALENANGQEVKFTSVANPDSVLSWMDCLRILEGRSNVYGLVPLTRNNQVLNMYATHAKMMSEVEQGLWRKVWISLGGVPEIPIVSSVSTVPGHQTPTTSDGLVAMAVVEDDPQTSGNQYTVLRDTKGTAKFITNEVASGDIVRILYTTDGFGSDVYSEFVVAFVSSEDQLTLVSGPDSAISVAAKFEIWRNLSADQEANELMDRASSWADRRICAVWPDRISGAGTAQEGYFLCCSLAGLASGVYPHQGLTNYDILGYDDVSRTTAKFSRTQLNRMERAGVWVVTQNISGSPLEVGRVYTRHGVTTGENTDINQREEVLTRNVDNILYQLHDTYEPFIGVTNVTPVMKSRLGTETFNLIEQLKTSVTTQDLGGQLLGGQVLGVQTSLLQPDRFIVSINLEPPYPFNDVTIQLTVGGVVLVASTANSSGSA